MSASYKVLDKPYTVEELRKLQDMDGYIKGIVRIDLSEIIDTFLEGFLDIISERLTGTELLSNISYKVVGHDENELHLEVSGCVVEILACEDE